MLELQSVTKSYRAPRGSTSPGARASGGVTGISISVKKGTFFTLLGPSGCGKTTTLRCIAGLELPESGVINIDGDVVFDDRRGIAVPANRRSIGMVFQSYAVWPHMTVFENVAFPLRVNRRRRPAEAEIARLVRHALETVGLGEYERRSATQLSGGQQQRLALARAIIHRPSLLLLDEPLSNLDVKLRETMRAELKRLQQQVGLTAIYVTHDQGEALAMSDTIAVLNRGRLVQCGTPDEIYYDPHDRFVAGFVGAANLIDAELLGPGSAPGRRSVRLLDGSVIECTRRAEGAGPVCICLRPEAIRVGPRGAPAGVPPGEENSLPGLVRGRIFLGNTAMLQVDAGGTALQVIANPADCPPPGAEVTIRFAVASALALDS